MFVIELSNGRGFVEYFQTLAVRAQARDRERAQQFATREEAEDWAQFCRDQPSCFSDGYFSHGDGRYTLTARVLPAAEE